MLACCAHTIQHSAIQSLAAKIMATWHNSIRSPSHLPAMKQCSSLWRSHCKEKRWDGADSRLEYSASLSGVFQLLAPAVLLKFCPQVSKSCPKHPEYEKISEWNVLRWQKAAVHYRGCAFRWLSWPQTILSIYKSHQTRLLLQIQPTFDPNSIQSCQESRQAFVNPARWLLQGLWCRALPACASLTITDPKWRRRGVSHIWVLSITMAHCDQKAAENNPHSENIVLIQLVWLWDNAMIPCVTSLIRIH